MLGSGPRSICIVFCVFNEAALVRDPLTERIPKGSMPGEPGSRRGSAGSNDTGVPGNVRQVFEKVTRSAHEEVHGQPAPGSEAANALERRLQEEWEEVFNDAEKYRQWHTIYTTRCSEARRRNRASRDARASDAVPGWCGLWGCSTDRRYILDPDAMAQRVRALPRAEARSGKDEALFVRAAEGHVLEGGWGDSVCGCFTQKKNVCRKHGPVRENAALVARLDSMTTDLTAWTKSLARGEADSCCQFLLLRPSAQPEGATDAEHQATRKCTIVQLVRPTWKPQMQFFVRCRLQSTGAMHFAELPPVPFRVELTQRHSRLTRGFVEAFGLNSLTSDELALSVSSTSGGWDMIPLDSEIATDVASLKVEIIKGLKAAFAGPAQRTAHARRVDDTSAMDLGELWNEEAGPDPAPFVQLLHRVQPDYDMMGDATGSETEEMMLVDAADPLFIDDAIEFAVGDDVPEVLEADPRAPHEDEFAEEELREVGRLIEAEADSGGEGDDVAEGRPLVATVEEAARATIVSDGGVLSCGLEPWCRQKRLGKIAYFPKDAHISEQRISIACHLHPNCRVGNVAACGPSGCTEQILLEWLYSGIPWSEYAQAHALREHHQGLWASRFKARVGWTKKAPREHYARGVIFSKISIGNKGMKTSFEKHS